MPPKKEVGMTNELQAVQIQNKILIIRNQQVMLDRDLAEMYGVETKVLNQAVKRNIQRFPERFYFQLSDEEFKDWKSQFVTSNSDKMGLRKKPYAFTEQGCAMLSAVLKSETAVQVSINIYVDLTILERLAKKKKNVNVTIYTDPKTKLTAQDIQKFNAQYPTLTMQYTTKMHDRFLIIDNTVLYHIGASLKDLGKKCFAFEVLETSLIPAILANV